MLWDIFNWSMYSRCCQIGNYWANWKKLLQYSISSVRQAHWPAIRFRNNYDLRCFWLYEQLCYTRNHKQSSTVHDGWLWPINTSFVKTPIRDNDYKNISIDHCTQANSHDATQALGYKRCFLYQGLISESALLFETSNMCLLTTLLSTPSPTPKGTCQPHPWSVCQWLIHTLSPWHIAHNK